MPEDEVSQGSDVAVVEIIIEVNNQVFHVVKDVHAV